MNAKTPLCKICQSPTEEIGRKKGKIDLREFVLFHCPLCNFSFVGNPRQDFSSVYSEAYYRGKGVDPLVNYMYELEHFDETIRVYEWRGILDVITSIYPNPLTSEVRWLDYGCGNGGLVRYVRSSNACDISGYDEGWIVEKAVESGIPVTRHKESLNSAMKFDIITAIEVLEHVEDPISVLREIRSIMRPGGLFFFTTRDSLPYRKNLLNWTYFRPDIHVSFYGSKNMEIALEKAGFRYLLLERLPSGWIDITRFKILKNLGIHRRNLLEKMIPWKWVSLLINKFMQIDLHPIAWATRDR
jgi:SAM-dependent methyltransferase